MGVADRNFRFVTLHSESKSIYMMIVFCDKTVMDSSIICGRITASNIHLPRSVEYLLIQIFPSQGRVNIWPKYHLRKLRVIFLPSYVQKP